MRIRTRLAVLVLAVLVAGAAPPADLRAPAKAVLSSLEGELRLPDRLRVIEMTEVDTVVTGPVNRVCLHSFERSFSLH